MAAQDLIKIDNILRALITLAILLSGFVTYKVWPLRERVSLAEQKIDIVCENQKEIKKNQELRPTEKELLPVLESIQKQFEFQNKQNEQHEAVCAELAKNVKDLEKIVSKLEAKL